MIEMINTTTILKKNSIARKIKTNTFFFSLLFLFLSPIFLKAQSYSVVGTGTAGNTSTTYPTPFGDYYENSKAQYLFQASELVAAGIPAGATISHIRWNVSALNAAGVHERYTIYAGTTTSVQIPNSAFLAVPDQQYGPVDYTPVSGNNTFTFTNPFIWNGTDNILVQICSNSANSTSGNTYTYNASVNWVTGLSFNGSYTVRNDDNNTLCGATTSASSSQTTRPNTSFGWCNTLTSYTVSGGGAICPGGDVLISLSGSQVGVNYQLKRGTTNIGSPVAGTGTAISFGNHSTSGTYTVEATGTGSFCSAAKTMTGSAVITAGTNSVQATSVSGPLSVISGTSNTYSVTGGSLGTGAVWNWYTGSCGGTLVAAGASYSPVVSGPVTYFVRAEGACNTTSCVSVSITAENACNAIYVDAVNGNDLYSGLASSPVKTLSKALSLVSGSRNQIKMTSGTYPESTILELQNDVVIEGRYVNVSGIWTKSSGTSSVTQINCSGSETISNDIAHVMGFKSDNKSNWKLIDLNITTLAATGQTANRKGKSNYALYITNGSSSYEITRCYITSGNASGGQGANTNSSLFNGSNGSNGLVGSTGNGGASSCSWSTDRGGSGGAGGAGGTGGANSTIIGGNAGSGFTGGAGGRGKDDDGYSGTAGSGRTGTCSGGGGSLGPDDSGNNDSPYGGNGADCTTNGTGGSNGSTVASSFVSGFYSPGYGTNGASGSGGGGGAGGGGGGVDSGSCAAAGSGGSGGSGGGGGGGAGAGGQGGGSSFGVFIWNAGTNGVINNSAINAGNYGEKGTGGAGGEGGSGGAKSAQGNTSSDGQSNRGGRGGQGSGGGKGGNGGDGTDGTSRAVAVQGTGTAPVFNATTPAIVVNTSVSGGSVTNSPVVTLSQVPNKICQNSVLNVTTTVAPWSFPGGWSFVRYNNSNVTSEFTETSLTADITTTNTTGFYNMTANGVVFNSYLNVKSDRTLPVITITPDPVCTGSTATFSATSWGNETEYLWELFTGSVADNKGNTTNRVALHSTASFNISNLPAGTYTIRYQVKESCCGWSIPVFRTFEVKGPVAEITTSDSTICHGMAVSIGGNITASGTWTINLSPSGSVTGTGTTWSATVTPSATTTYSIASVSDGCTGIGTGSTTISLPAKGTALSGNESATCYVSGNNPIHFYASSGNYIGSINPQGRAGTLTMTSYLDAGGTMYACGVPASEDYRTAFMGRHFTVVPTGTISGSGNLSVYFPYSQTEYSDLAAASIGTTTSNVNDNVTSHSSIAVTKYSNPGNEDGNPFNNCSGGSALVVLQSGNGNLTDLSLSPVITGTNYYASFGVSSFSEFYLHGVNANSPLPITLTSFTASCEDKVSLMWKTATETNVSHYEILRSRDGQFWEEVATIPAVGNSTTEQVYHATDATGLETMYYKLRSVDNDGTSEDFQPVSVTCNPGALWSIHPVPVSVKATVTVTATETSHDLFVITDINGRVVTTQQVEIKAGTSIFELDLHRLSEGTYFIRMNQSDKYSPLKFIKVN